MTSLDGDTADDRRKTLVDWKTLKRMGWAVFSPAYLPTDCTRRDTRTAKVHAASWRTDGMESLQPVNVTLDVS